MGAEVGRGSLVDGEMGEGRTIPEPRIGGVDIDSTELGWSITHRRSNYPHISNAAKARTLLHKTIPSMSA